MVSSWCGHLVLVSVAFCGLALAEDKTKTRGLISGSYEGGGGGGGGGGGVAVIVGGGGGGGGGGGLGQGHGFGGGGGGGGGAAVLVAGGGGFGQGGGVSHGGGSGHDGGGGGGGGVAVVVGGGGGGAGGGEYKGGSGRSCRYWCKTPKRQTYCCENNNEPAAAFPSVKSGRCPPVRPDCPPTRSGFYPPTTCSNDSKCPGSQKCCYDTCLEHHTCKQPLW